MPDDDKEYGFPHIPYTRLRELKNHAEMVVVAAIDGSFKGIDLWRIFVGLEVNSLLANHWYNEVQELKEKLAHYEQKDNEATRDSNPIGTESQRSSQ